MEKNSFTIRNVAFCKYMCYCMIYKYIDIIMSIMFNAVKDENSLTKVF